MSEPLIDKAGRIFNAAKHLSRQGVPVLSRLTGMFMPKGGRKKKAAAAPISSPQPANQPAPKMTAPTTPTESATLPETPPATTAEHTPADLHTPKAPEPAPSFDDVLRNAPDDSAPEKENDDTEPNGRAVPMDSVSITAETGIHIIQTALVMIGEEEGILSEAEKISLREPLKVCIRKYGIGEPPPELGAIVALAQIIISRLGKPKTATKWVKLKTWFVGVWFNHKGRQTAAAIREHTAAAS